MQTNFTYTPCHTDGMHILTIGQCTIHASGSKHSYTDYALVINLTGFSYQDRELVTCVGQAKKLAQQFYEALPASPKPIINELRIDWHDGGVPDLDKSDWIRLIKDLSQINGKVLVHCMGGHGRTGTLLTILLSLSRALKKDPVQWLRKQYCEKVVETQAQIQYLKKLGVMTTCAPRHMVAFNQGPYQWKGNSFIQEQYELTKGPSSSAKFLDNKKDLEPLYKCILCCRSHIAASFYQTFLDMTGFCWSCHQLTNKTNGDIQSA